MATDYGLDTSITLRTVALPFPDGSTRAVTALQPDKDFHVSTGRARLSDSLVCRLLTDRGTVPDVVIPSTTRNVGYNVEDLLNADLDVRGRAEAAAFVGAECRKDSRVNRADVTTTPIANTVTISIAVYDGRGPFPLVLAISDVSTLLLSAPR